MSRVSLEKDKIKILLLEGVHPNTVDTFKAAGYTNIEYLKGSLEEAELIEKIQDVHFVGIRSRSNLNQRVLDAAKKLVAIGCFCIGTNQVDLKAAAARGIPVFNAPFSNTRSVAELVLGEILLLLRNIPAKNAKAHRGEWDKSANNSVEARGKKLGIIGYGHIGTQLSIIAESIGMKVFYYDIENKLSLGNATQVGNLHDLLGMCDIVSLHVPELPSTQWMIGAAQIAKMKPGAILINASRGSVVDIDALVFGQTNILVGDPVHHLIDVLTAHRRLPGQQLVEQQPGGEHVGRLGAFPPFDVFGCHVRRRAHERLAVTALRFNARSDAEIHHARHVRAVEQDVVRFEIAVNDACCVRVRDRVENGDQDGNRLHRRQSAVCPQVFGKIQARYVLEDEIKVTTFLARLEDWHDIRMTQLADHARF